MNFDNSLLIAANIIIAAVYIIYLKQVIKSESTPNPATWIIWAIVMTMNAVTYTFVVNNYLKAAIAIFASLFIYVILIYSFKKGRLSPLEKTEKRVLLLSFIVGAIWAVTGSEKLANILLQFVLILSFWPTAKGLWLSTAKEKHWPWTLAVIAYTFQIAGLIINPENDYAALLFPFLNGVVGNGVIAFLAYVKINKVLLQYKKHHENKKFFKKILWLVPVIIIFALLGIIFILLIPKNQDWIYTALTSFTGAIIFFGFITYILKLEFTHRKKLMNIEQGKKKKTHSILQKRKN